MTEESLEQRIARVEKEAQRARDVQAVQNVMSMHSLLDAQGKDREQFHTIWAKNQPDVCWINNHGMWIGPENLEHYYCDIWDIKRKDRLELITQLYPHLEKDSRNDLIGWMKMHTMCTPIIEVAEDGKTAKGMWESPGFITSIIDGKIQAAWIWERHAVDFIKEESRWKIWHFNALVQFITPYEKSWVETAMASDLQISDPYEPTPDKMHNRNLEFQPDKLVGPLSPDFPKPPEPYRTFSETFSYGP